MALNFPNTPADGQLFTDTNGQQWVYETATNTWTALGLQSGGMIYKGGITVTTAAPTGAQSGWLYVANAAGVAHTSFTGIAGQTIAKGSQLLYDGSAWTILEQVLPIASETVKGLVELATAAETTAGTDATRAVHPKGLKVELDKKVAKAGDTMTGNLTVPSLNGGPLAGFRNLLINSDYGIAQRYTDYPWTATGVVTNPNASLLFGPDRWGTTQFREFQSRNERPDNSFAGSLQWRKGTQASATWLQVIELLGKAGNGPRLDPLLEADTWTVSHWIFTADRSTFSCNISYVEKGYSPAIESPIASIADGDWAVVDTKGDWTRVAASFSMAGVAAAPAGALGIRVQFVNNGNIRAVGAQLEPGPVATPFEHRPMQTELALCQRYFETTNLEVAANGNSGGAVDSYWFFKVTKRASPTIVLGAGNAGNLIRTGPEGATLRSAAAGSQVTFGDKPTASAEL